MTRYVPNISLTSGSTDLSTWYDRINGSITATTSVPEMTVHMMKSTPTDLISHRSPILLTVDGTRLFYGLVDDPTSSTDKKKGYAKEIKCRGYASRWLDTYSSIHRASDSAYDIAARILNEYNNRRGGSDPLIGWKTNHAPINLSYPIFQRRESIQDMFMGLAQLLAAPQGFLGGADCMFDFYVDANGQATFDRVAEEWATKDGSHLQLNDSHRTVTKQETRGTPVKNDIWLWGGQTSGRLPLEMQNDYMNQAPRGNPSYRVYWYLPFPFNQWPIGQEPNGRLNFFNEAPNYREKKWDGSLWTNATGMSEQMGEIQGIGFYLYSTASFDWYIEFQDHFNHKVRTATERYDVGLWPTAYWKPYLNIPIGPSANMEGSENATEPFDWSCVKEIRWVCKNGPAYSWPIWFDGLRLIKPLVVHFPDYNMSGGANPYNEPWHPQSPPYSYRSLTSLSTEIVNEQSVDDWKVGKRIASSIYESKAYPQAYWTIEGFGVTECIPSQRFLYGTTELCMRENRFSITKEDGFCSTITAVAAYRSGRWSNECLADFGRILKEVTKPIGKLNRSISGS
ncbi:MAG: hypothetical protein NTX81_01045 [Candidatus Bathyarchaeota archaeon]|nr:hypothetical protein [Candidatus Bathyarchaeota archaeon]